MATSAAAHIGYAKLHLGLRDAFFPAVAVPLLRPHPEVPTSESSSRRGPIQRSGKRRALHLAAGLVSDDRYISPSSTASMLPAGSLNQAMAGPRSSRAIPFSSCSKPS